jgi:SAM-dependent methyltransferase
VSADLRPQLGVWISTEIVPLCPVTSQPAIRRVQTVTTRLLVDLWRIIFNTDALDSLAGIDRIGLWESPTGLYFFDPPLEGDHKFYTQFYARLKRWRLFSDETVREEFLIASKFIPLGARVLDVGCGHGSFRQCVPQADYTGLDPNFATGAAIEGIRSETLAQHLIRHVASYDAVCCFQVIEHVRDPKALFAEIVQAAKPGGLICVGVPQVPSALTRIPNFLLNAPPHHLTWWTKAALSELATSGGAVVESVESTPWGSGDSGVYWIERCSPIKCSDIHFRGALKWHAATLIGHVLGTLAFMLLGAPRTTADEGAGLLMIARRPAAR